MPDDLSVVPASPGGTVAAAVAGGLGALDEWQAKRLLAEYGVPVPGGGVAHD